MSINSYSSITEKCCLFLSEWRKDLSMTNYERFKLKGATKILDNQLDRLANKHLRIAVYGKAGVGKSSLLNALINSEFFATDVANGSTRKTATTLWREKIKSLKEIELIDTPGIDEINLKTSNRFLSRLLLQVDLILFVLDGDISSTELTALKTLLNKGKPIQIILNRCDQWTKDEQNQLIKSIKKRLPSGINHLKIHTIAASPRRQELTHSKKIRSFKSSPKIEEFKTELIDFLSIQGEIILAINSLRQTDNFHQSLKACRMKKSKAAAQSLIGRYAAVKASGVAANPLLILDCAGSLACDTALVVQLSRLYGLQLKKKSARELLKNLSIYSSFLGGAQIGIQLAIGLLRQLLLLATPITHGLSLASSAPIALIQAALAVQTTKLTGRLAAKELLQGSIRQKTRAKGLLKRLSNDPQIKYLLRDWPERTTLDSKAFQSLLP